MGCEKYFMPETEFQMVWQYHTLSPKQKGCGGKILHIMGFAMCNRGKQKVLQHDLIPECIFLNG